MSDKKWRDIKLGDIQDECKRINGTCVGLAFVTEDCKYKGVCPFQMQSRKALAWDLSDPPRFTEAQMAFWRELFNVGVKYVYNGVSGLFLSDCVDGDGNMGVIKKSEAVYWLKAADRIDLEQLLGKDGK